MMRLNDRALGVIIALLSVAGMIGYFAWAFGPSLPMVDEYITPEISEWAFKLPILLAVYAIFFIIIWIGYTMATTPPPLPLDNPLDLDRGDSEKKE